MSEQLRPEPKDLGEAATATLNPEPRTLPYTFSLQSCAVFQLSYGNAAFFNESFSSFIQKRVTFIATMPYSDYKHSKRSGDWRVRKASTAGIFSLRDFKGENNEKT